MSNEMKTDILLGIIIFVLAYGLIIFLNLWSRKTINFIAKRNLRTLSEITEELRNGK